MILLRAVEEKDVEGIEKLSHVPGMFNLSGDRDQIREKIIKSRQSFEEKLKDSMEGKYIFVAEDTRATSLVGTSMIAAQHGTEESPHFYFEVGSEQKMSESINTGFIHGTLILKYETDGPSEIGALVIDPSRRNSPERIGRQISFVRFLFLAMFKDKFKSKVIAELLPPLNKRGQSPLWEAIGRRFTSMDYWEADQLCSKNKEFIFSLFPTGKIYTTFLSAEARNAIGKVGKDTEPVLHMLKKIGFQYKNHVDPFDGGPHLWAEVEKIVPVQKFRKGKVKSVQLLNPSAPQSGNTRVSGLMARASTKSAGFCAVSVEVEIKGEDFDVWVDDPDAFKKALGLELTQSDKDIVGFMPYY